MNRKFDLEERLLDYAAAIIRLIEEIPRTKASNHVVDHLLRAATSPLFNHGEAEAAESNNDFIHKLKICLKELNESGRALRLIERVPLVEESSHLTGLLQETTELRRIFAASIRTAQRNSEPGLPPD